MRLMQQGLIASSGGAPVGEPRAFQTDGISKHVSMGALFAGTVGDVTPAFTLALRVEAPVMSSILRVVGSDRAGDPVELILFTNGRLRASVARASSGSREHQRLSFASITVATPHIVVIAWDGDPASYPSIYVDGANVDDSTSASGSGATDFDGLLTIARNGTSYSAIIVHEVAYVPGAALDATQAAELTTRLAAHAVSTGDDVATTEAAVVSYLIAIAAGSIYGTVDSLDNLTTSIRDACGNANLTPINMENNDLVAVPS